MTCICDVSCVERCRLGRCGTYGHSTHGLGNRDCGLSPLTSAQAADAPESSDIIVTATRSGAALEDLATSVSVVDEEKLSAQFGYSTNVMRALEFSVPGLAPQRESRSHCSPNIRGLQTSIQINGIPVNENIRQSTCDQMYQLSPFAVERVEVLRGGTVLYGAGSPGGIINFVTRRAKGRHLEVDLVAQTSFNTSNTAASGRNWTDGIIMSAPLIQTAAAVARLTAVMFPRANMKA